MAKKSDKIEISKTARKKAQETMAKKPRPVAEVIEDYQNEMTRLCEALEAHSFRDLMNRAENGEFSIDLEVKILDYYKFLEGHTIK